MKLVQSQVECLWLSFGTHGFAICLKGVLQLFVGLFGLFLYCFYFWVKLGVQNLDCGTRNCFPSCGRTANSAALKRSTGRPWCATWPSAASCGAPILPRQRWWIWWLKASRTREARQTSRKGGVRGEKRGGFKGGSAG